MIRAISTQVMAKNGKSLTINNIESECQPLLTSSIKSAYINSFNGNRLGNGNQEMKEFWRTKMYVGEKNEGLGGEL